MVTSTPTNKKRLSVLTLIFGLTALFATVFWLGSVGTPTNVVKEAHAAASWMTGWNYRKKITISHANVDANLADFPLLVKINADTDLAMALSTGNDIRFTSADGTTLLKYERESWTGGGGTAVTANIWVKVPTISGSTNTDIYIYYGNAAALDGQDAANVWDANFKGVWHMKESTGVNVADSTRNANTGTPTNGPTQTTGKIGNALSFDGTDDYVQLSSVNLGANHTFSVWIKSHGLHIPCCSAIFGTNNLSLGNVLRILDSSRIRYQTVWDNYVQTTNAYPSVEIWEHYVVARNDLTVSFYKNGVLKDSPTLGSNSALTISRIGMTGTIDYFNGLLDDVRISSVARSAEWIKFEYNNMNSANSELTFAIQEASKGATPPPPSTTYTLTTIATNGTITKNSNQTSYNQGTLVTLTAVPSTDYQFSSWSGDTTGTTNPTTVTMNSNKNITANFTATNPNPTTHTITSSAGTDGTISPSGVTTVTQGSNQTFTITPNAGYQISSVTVDGTNQEAISTYTFSNITSNHTISVSFSIIPIPPSSGTVHIDSAWLTQNGPAPYVLTSNDTTYILDTDITTDGTAIVIGAKNVVLDLNGHTITYGNSTPLNVVNGTFAQGTGNNVPGWDMSTAPHATIVPNTFYLPGSSQCLEFTNISATESIVSDPITIPTANREYAATITALDRVDYTTMNLSVVDTVTGTVLATDSTNDSTGGFSLVVKFIPTTTNPIKLKIDITPKTAGKTVTTNLSYVTLTTSRDFGVLASPMWALPPHLVQFRPVSTNVANVTIKNGSITQGQARGYASYPVIVDSMQGSQINPAFTVDGVTISANGIDTDSVHAIWSAFGVIQNSVFHNDIPYITNRMAKGAVIFAQSSNDLLVQNNTMYDAPHIGVWFGNTDAAPASGAIIRNNTMYPNVLVTNGYGVLLYNVNNFEISGNRIIAGSGKSGIGISLDGSAKNGTVFGNYVDIRQKGNPEYGINLHAVAFRLRIGYDAGVQNVSVHDNTFIARGGDKGYYPGGIGARLTLNVPDASGVNLHLDNNTFEGITYATNQDPFTGQYSAGLEVVGWTPTDMGMTLIGNTFISNDASLRLGGDYGNITNGVKFTSSTFTKSTEGTALSGYYAYASVRAGYSTSTVHGMQLIDNRYENGATEQIVWGGSGAKDISTGWLLNIITKNTQESAIPGATIKVFDKDGTQIVSGTTNADGTVSDIQMITTIYRQLTTNPANITSDQRTPHRVEVSAPGYATYTNTNLTLSQSQNLNITMALSGGVSTGSLTEYTPQEPINPITTTYTLTTSATNGTITKNPNQTSYNQGTTVTLTASPSTGYQFSGWSGDLTGVTNPAAITMTSNKSVTATFTQTAPVTYTLTTSAGAGGIIAPSGVTTIHEGNSQTFEITPASGYGVSDVTVDGTSVGALNTYTFTNVTTNHTIAVSFVAVDSTPPAAITDLSALNPTSSEVSLAWSAPSDKEDGKAESYDIRYGTESITEANFALAKQVANEARPKQEGKSETYTVANLSPATTYFFAIKSSDMAGNVSALSNVASIKTNPAQSCEPDATKVKPVSDLFTIDTVNDPRNVPNFNILKTNIGKIRFKQPVKLVREDTPGCFSALHMDSLIEIKDRSIQVSSTAFPDLNVPATIIFYNITFTTPVIKKDGVLCADCVMTYDTAGKTVTVEVQGFSTYTVEEGYSAPPPVTDDGGTTNGGGGGGGGSRRTLEERIEPTSNETDVLPPIEESLLFRDVPLHAWFKPFVYAIAELGIASGYADASGKPLHLFGPANPVTYAEIARMGLEAAEKSPQLPSPLPQNPLARNHWAMAYIAKAERLKLSVYTPSLMIDRPATRGEVIQTLIEAFGLPMEEAENPYHDLPAGHPYVKAILTATKYGIIRGDTASDGTLRGTVRPDDSINRAEVSKIIILLLKASAPAS